VKDGFVEFRPNPNIKAQFRAAQLRAVKEVFELDIKPEAVANSPVTEAGLAHNLSLHRHRPGGTGTNRRSIDTEVIDTPKGPQATLFTQSGYGGYLEIGTRFMAAQPYLWPAFRKFVNKIPQRIKELVGKKS
jgi:HK97 gp10 family phage protein